MSDPDADYTPDHGSTMGPGGDDGLGAEGAQAEPTSSPLEDLKLLSYWLPPDHEPSQYWTHEAYRNAAGDTVKIEYCKDRISSERVAKGFLKCPVVGFDMEWAPFGAKGIKGNISVIQVACEDKIALFHIALHQGRTVAELLCPSLRKLIEDEKILKCGVAINNADGNRLRKWMKLEPRGMLELSHLHRVTKWAKRDPSRVSKRLIKLTHLAEEHLGRPLHKGSVRTSNWTQPLTEEQIRYAAADAYSGFRIFHALETKRLAQSAPRPSRPAPAEQGLPLLPESWLEDTGKKEEEGTQHASKSKAGKNTEIAEVGTSSSNTKTVAPAPAPPAKPTFKMPSIDYLSDGDPVTRRAFSALKALRKRLSLKLSRSESEIATDATLFGLAERRPRSAQELDGDAAWKALASTIQAHTEIDLLAFLAKHAPPALDEASPVKDAVIESSQDETPNAPPDRDRECSNHNEAKRRDDIEAPADAGPEQAKEAAVAEDADDLEKYFSEDDFDDTEYDPVENDLDDDDDGDFEALTTSFGHNYTSMPRLRSLHTF